MFCIPSLHRWFVFPFYNDVVYSHITKIKAADGDNKGFPVLSTDFTEVFPTTEVWKQRDNFILETHRVWPIPANAIDTSRETLSQNLGW